MFLPCRSNLSKKLRRKLEHNSSIVETLHDKGVDRSIRLLIILNEIGEPAAVKSIKEFALEHGATEIPKWNISAILSRTSGQAIRVGGAWRIARPGMRRLKELGYADFMEEVPQAILSLEKHFSRLQSEQVRQFVNEAIQAARLGLHRSAVVLSWVGAVAVLRDYIVQNHLKDFNRALRERFEKQKPIKNVRQLARIQEADFLQLLEDMAVFDKPLKKQLTQRLDLRNGCGHPNDLELGPNQVANHIEQLLLNVFVKYG